MDNENSPNPAALRDQLLARLQAVDEQIAALSREANALQADLEVTDRFLNVWKRTATVVGPEGLRTYAPGDHPIVTVSLKKKNPPRDWVATQALEIIKDAGRPMQRAELYEALRARRVFLHGKDPVMVLSTMLWRSDDRIVRLNGYGYWPKDESYPPAAYFPQWEAVMQVTNSEPEDGVIEEDDDEAEASS